MRTYTLLLLSIVFFCTCKKSPPKNPATTISSLPGKWIQIADFGGGGRARAFALTIGTKSYIVGGHSGQGSTLKLLSDFWEYDPSTDKWTQKADYPGRGWEYLRGFSINNKGYIGTGF